MAKKPTNSKVRFEPAISGVVIIKHKTLHPSESESATEQQNQDESQIPDEQNQHGEMGESTQPENIEKETVQEENSDTMPEEQYDEDGQEYGMSEDEVRDEIKPIYEMLVENGHNPEDAANIACEMWSDKHDDHERMSEEEKRAILPEAYADNKGVGKAQTTQASY